MKSDLLFTLLLILMPLSVSQAGSSVGDLSFTPAQRLRADRLVSVFENGTQVLQYSYVENIHDGCGYTTGRAGFCTSTGDMLAVVELYSQQAAKNPLAKYLPRLRELAQKSSESTSGLNGYPSAVAHAARDAKFRKAQDQIVDQMYFQPAVTFANQLNLKLPFSLAAFYETGIQFGWGGGKTSVQGLSKDAAEIATAKYGKFTEAQFLYEFLKLRRDDLANSPIQAARDSVGRGNAMLKLLRSKNLEFHGPIVIAPYSPFEVFRIP
jgi:chitosanase